MASKRTRDEVGIDPNRIVSAAVDAALGQQQSEPPRKKHHPGRVLAAGAALAAAAAVGQRRMPRLAKVPLRRAAHKLGDAMHVDELAGAVQDRIVGRDREPADDYDDEDLDPVDEFDDEDELDDEEPEDLDPGEDPEEPLDEAEEPDDEDDEGFDDEDDGGFDDEPEDEGGPEGEGDADEPDEEGDDDPEAESEDPPADEEPIDEDDEPEDEEPADDDEEDDEKVAARGLDLGVAPGTSRSRRRDQAPDLFAALRTPRRRAPVMGRQSRRVDPATRPPEPERSRSRDNGDRRANNSKSMAARR